MKIGVVGTGMVGATAAYALVMQGRGSELVLVDKNEARARAEADDIWHAVPFAHPIRVSSGDYADLAHSRVVIIAAGVAQRPDETRLQLLQRNAAIFRTVVPSIVEHAPDALLVVATNPVDIMTHLTAHYAAEHGVPPERVLGSGTMLDSARFRALLAQRLGVDANHVHGYVVGEHGDSEVLVWSRVTVGVIPLADYCADQGIVLDADTCASIDHDVRNAAYHIISGKGATYYGVGSALARLIYAILDDQRAILTVCAPMPHIAGVDDVTISMPHMVGGRGNMGTLALPLSSQEQEALHNSARVVRAAIDELL